MALLALPIGLTLAATLAQSGISDLRRVEHLSELYGRLLQTRDQEIQREFRPGWSVYSPRSEEHTSELQSLMRISYAVFCLQKKKKYTKKTLIRKCQRANKHRTQQTPHN